MPKYGQTQGVQKTASAQVSASGVACLLYGYSIKIGNGGGNTIIEFRNGGASGTIQWEDGEVKTDDLGDAYVTHNFSVPMLFSSDLYVKIASGDNAEVNVAYNNVPR